MQGGSAELREACAAAIGANCGRRGTALLANLPRDEQSESVRAGGAEALLQLAYQADGRLGLGYWFLSSTLELEQERPDPQSAGLELLVVLYWLRAHLSS